MIEYNEVNHLLSLEFPSFNIEPDYWDLPYLVASDFTRFVLQAYQLNDKDTYEKGLRFIERLHIEGSEKVKELATIGFLESFLDWPNVQDLYCDFGIESKKWWDELNLFWSGKIKYVGESFNLTK